ncbi:MAG: glycosyltransferase family 4 protein [Sulfuritalea sp.]|nr:glycosyltransferase family 4 protein [Sulfuritalea sp.]
MILFLFKNGRAARLASAGVHPTEFFYGYRELCALGWPVSMLDEEDLGIRSPLPLPGRLLAVLGRALGGLPIAALSSLARPENLQRLNQAAAIIATTNSFGVGAAILKRLGYLKPVLFFLPMGLARNPLSPWLAPFYRWALNGTRILSISRGEQVSLSRALGAGVPVDYLPFGVDERFWQPGEADDDGYVLSIGNDESRDYATLVAAWRPEYPRLRIVTRLPVPTTAANIEIIRGDWRSQILSDEEILRLYQRARFVVLAIRETLQPSGQSACLQAMACGKAVIFSDIQGLWDRQLMVDGESLLLTRPGDPIDLRRAIEKLLASPASAAKLGQNARQVIDEHLNVRLMARQLASYLESRVHSQS